MQLGHKKVKQKVEKPAMMGEARVVNEAYVKTILLLCICSVRTIWLYVRVICNLETMAGQTIVGYICC